MKTKYRNKRKGNKRVSKKYKSSSVYDVKPRGKHKFILFLFILSIIALYYVIPDSIEIKIGIDDMKKEEIKEIVREVLDEETIQLKADETEKKTESTEKKTETKKDTTSRSGSSTTRTTSTKKLTGFRITSYHPGDNCKSGTKTGSGKSVKDFSTMKIGKKNVYTYKGKIVVAAATEELLKSGYNVKGSGTRQSNKHYFRYYDEIKISIDGKYYDAIVLDSCGAAMWKGEYRIDIFVPSASDVINKSNVTVKL